MARDCPFPREELRSVDAESLRRLRLAILELERGGNRVSVRAVREIAKIATDKARVVVKLYMTRKKGQEGPSLPDAAEPWELLLSKGSATPLEKRGPGRPRSGARTSNNALLPAVKTAVLGEPDEEDDDPSRVALARLIGMVRTAESDADREAIQHEVCALALGGLLEKWQAEVVERTLKEARQAAKAHRDADTGHDPTRMILAGPEVVGLARAYEGIVSAERRAQALRVVAELAREDLAEHGKVDTSPQGQPEPAEEEGAPA